MGLLSRFRKDAPKAETKIVVADGVWGANAVSNRYVAQHGGRSITQTFADVHFVYEVVSRISNATSTLPIKVMVHGENGVKLDAPDHPASRLIRKPNPTTPRSLLIAGTVGDLCLHGNAFWLKVRSATGVPSELWRLRPERMTPIPNAESGHVEGWVHRVGNKQDIYLAEDVIHFRNYNPNDDYLGISPIRALRYQVELGRDAEDAAIDLWANGARSTGVLESPLPLSDEAVERLGAQLRQLASKGGRYRTPILEEGVSFRPWSMSPKDAEFIETANLTRQRVAFAFGYPLSDQYSARATPDEIRKGLFADAVLPWTVLIEETLEVQLMSEFGDDGAFPQFQMRHILDPNVLERYQAYKEGIYGGWLPPQYVAKLEDIPPDSGPTFIPMNMNEVDEEGHIVPPATPGPEKDSTGGLGGDPSRDGPSTGSGNAKALVDEGLKKGAQVTTRSLRDLLREGVKTTERPETDS